MVNDPLLGRTIADRFTIRRCLGEGGMAKVYLAEQAAEPREVALKILNEDLTLDRTFTTRFRREAQAAARVQHPGSVRILDYGVADNLPYIAMELLVGDDLYALLERHGALSQGRAARLLAEVCDVLSKAHDLGIVHRDLKPENIMVIADPGRPGGERVKVLDFGIAKLLVPERASNPEPTSSALSGTGTVLGTPAYMSPEQCSQQPVDPRSDLYTCGVLLFQMITGRVPFVGETPLHTATLHLHEEPPRPSALAPGIDPRLEALILKALSKKPSGRPPSARHFGEALRRMLADLPDVTVAAGQVTRRPLGARPRPQLPSSSDDTSPPMAIRPARDSDPTARYVAPQKPSHPDVNNVDDTAQTMIRRSTPDADDAAQTMVRRSAPDLHRGAAPSSPDARGNLPTLESLTSGPEANLDLEETLPVRAPSDHDRPPIAAPIAPHAAPIGPRAPPVAPPAPPPVPPAPRHQPARITGPMVAPPMAPPGQVAAPMSAPGAASARDAASARGAAPAFGAPPSAASSSPDATSASATAPRSGSASALAPASAASPASAVPQVAPPEDAGNPAWLLVFFGATLGLSLLLVAYYFLVASGRG